MNPLLQSVQLAIEDGTQTEALAFIDQVVDFLVEQENGKVLKGWKREWIRLLVGYHIAKKTIIVEEENENVLGVGMWYHCNEDADWFFIQKWEPDEEDGNAIFIGFLNAVSTNVFKEITRKFVGLYPDIEDKKIIMMRHRCGVPTRVESTYKLFNKILAI
jgi:hypothetical protein